MAAQQAERDAAAKAERERKDAEFQTRHAARLEREWASIDTAFIAVNDPDRDRHDYDVVDRLVKAGMDRDEAYEQAVVEKPRYRVRPRDIDAPRWDTQEITVEQDAGFPAYVRVHRTGSMSASEARATAHALLAMAEIAEGLTAVARDISVDG